MNYLNILVLAILLVVYFVVHSFLANLRVKEHLMKNIISQKYYRLVYNFFSITLLFPIAWWYFMVPSKLLFENLYLSYLGFGMLLLGFGLIGVSLQQYNLSEFSGVQQLSKSDSPISAELNTSGLNSMIRHPLYTSSLILLWAWFLYRPTDSVLALVLVTTIYIYFGTKLEEQKLVKEFGADYVKYQEQVSMLIPFLF